MNIREKADYFCKTFITGLLITFSLAATNNSAWAKFAIYAQTTLNIELTGYNALTGISLFKGSITADESQEIDTSYRGLALLIHAGGQTYPVIIGEDFFTLKITTPSEPPSFTVGSENELFYQMLSVGEPEGQPYSFALLMIQAKQLLESSHSIRTLAELAAKKKEFHDFVREHYAGLQHSDMVLRLLAQYFMMHEYVDYHVEGAPATDIKIKYHHAIMNGVKNWLETLKSHIPEHEILNYCVSLYYDRSMVALAALIMANFRDVVFCPGDDGKTFNFPEDLLLTDAKGNKEKRLNAVQGKKIVALVSTDCPVSMVDTVLMARRLVEQEKDITLIVAPLEELSEKYFAMNRMISGGNILFINDERWRQENMAQKMRLPSFHRINTSSN